MRGAEDCHECHRAPERHKPLARKQRAHRDDETQPNQRCGDEPLTVRDYYAIEAGHAANGHRQHERRRYGPDSRFAEQRPSDANADHCEEVVKPQDRMEQSVP
jgi:hypothetical protein